MKKSGLIVLTLFLASCGSTSIKSTAILPLYEVLTQQIDGGANIRFFEILTEEKEITMLQNDEKLKNKIKPNDILNANFVILNMGEKTTGGYKIGVEKVEETEGNIIITIKETSPDPNSGVTQAFTYPYSVVKINSKKAIIIK